MLIRANRDVLLGTSISVIGIDYLDWGLSVGQQAYGEPQGKHSGEQPLWDLPWL